MRTITVVSLLLPAIGTVGATGAPAAAAQSAPVRLSFDSGILNIATGSVVMNGTVTDGWLEGAHVHETGQLVNAATLGFQGSIRLRPAIA